MSRITKTIGIIGAGKLGVTVAQLALRAGYEVFISGSGDPAKIALTTSIITPGALATTTEEAVSRADIVVLALPLGKFRELDPAVFTDKLVIDGMNHWYEVDGPLEAIIPDGGTTSEAVQCYFSKARVVKALNHMGYHHLHDETKRQGLPGRKAIAIAGDDKLAVSAVSRFVDSLGFDPYEIGELSMSRILEAGQPAFGANLSQHELSGLVESSFAILETVPNQENL